MYSVDGLEYKGEVISEAANCPDSGRAYVTVRFSGYGNEETIWVDQLLPSQGEEAVKDQEKRAAGGGEEAQPEEKAKAVSNMSIGLWQIVVNVIPLKEPSSPETWALGSHCRTIFSVDGMEYEGDIATAPEVDPESGRQYATIRFIGFGNEETIWLDQLLPSQGDAARKDQEARAKADEGGTTEPVGVIHFLI